jgi:transcriptional regulator with XRE-family HTH domain
MAERTEGRLQNNLGYNLQRLMADQGLTTEQVAETSALDKRTVMGILHGTKKAQPRTIGRLAAGLGVPTEELLAEPAQRTYRSKFDQDTNPVVERVIESHPEVFAGWTAWDYDELHSRMGTGGPLTAEGALAAAQQMNAKRELHEKLSVLLESSEAEVIAGIVELMYQKVSEEKS